MIVKRDKLNFWERLYLPALWGGLRVTWRHFYRTAFKRAGAGDDAIDLKKMGGAAVGYRGCALSGQGPGRPHQMCLVPIMRICLSAQGHSHHAARAAGFARGRQRGEVPKEFEINMLRCWHLLRGYCQAVRLEEAIFLMQVTIPSPAPAARGK